MVRADRPRDSLDRPADNPVWWGRCAIVMVWLALFFRCGGAALIALALDGSAASAARLDHALQLAGPRSPLSGFVHAAAALALLRWIYVTNRNAHALGSGLRLTPAGSVAWFFVPIASWFKPYQGLADVWRITMLPEAKAGVAAPRQLRWLWGLWLGYRCCETLALHMHRGGWVPPFVIGAFFEINVLAIVTGALFSLLATRVIARLSARQCEALAALSDAVFPSNDFTA